MALDFNFPSASSNLRRQLQPRGGLFAWETAMLTQKRGARKKHRVFRRLQAEDELHARVETNSLKKVEGIVIWDSGPFCCFSAQIGSVPRTPICKGLTNFLKQALFPSVRAAGAPGEV